MMERFMEGSTLYEGSVGNFYSPFESPNASDDEDDEDDETGVRIPRRFRRKKDHPLSDQVVSLYNVQAQLCFSFDSVSFFVQLLARS